MNKSRKKQTDKQKPDPRHNICTDEQLKSLMNFDLIINCILFKSNGSIKRGQSPEV